MASGEALIAFGELEVDEFDQAQLGRLVIESGDVPKVKDFGLFWREEGLSEALRLLDCLEDALQRAEVSGFDDFGFAVNALAVADVVVREAFDDFAGEGRHG